MICENLSLTQKLLTSQLMGMAEGQKLTQIYYIIFRVQVLYLPNLSVI